MPAEPDRPSREASERTVPRCSAAHFSLPSPGISGNPVSVDSGEKACEPFILHYSLTRPFPCFLGGLSTKEFHAEKKCISGTGVRNTER